MYLCVVHVLQTHKHAHTHARIRLRIHTRMLEQTHTAGEREGKKKYCINLYLFASSSQLSCWKWMKTKWLCVLPSGHRDDGSGGADSGYRSGEVELTQENRSQGPALRWLGTQMVRGINFSFQIVHFVARQRQFCRNVAVFCFDSARSVLFWFIGTLILSFQERSVKNKSLSVSFSKRMETQCPNLNEITALFLLLLFRITCKIVTKRSV